MGGSGPDLFPPGEIGGRTECCAVPPLSPLMPASMGRSDAKLCLIGCNRCSIIGCIPAREISLNEVTKFNHQWSTNLLVSKVSLASS